MIGGCCGSALAAFYAGLTIAKGIYIKAGHETSVRRIHFTQRHYGECTIACWDFVPWRVCAMYDLCGFLGEGKLSLS